MADPLEKVRPGDGFAIRADTWNAFIDAARAHRRNEAGAAGAGRPTPDNPTPGCTVYVRNDTGSTLPAWSTVKLGTPVVDAATYPFRVSSEPVFPATEPDGADIPFAVTTQPIRDGKLGTAVVLGVAVADVSVSNSAHTHAAPANASLVLASGTSGPARIIWKESGTGTLKAVVLLDRTGSGGTTIGSSSSSAASSAASWSFTSTSFASVDTLVVPALSLAAGRYRITAHVSGMLGAPSPAGGIRAILARLIDTTSGNPFGPIVVVVSDDAASRTGTATICVDQTFGSSASVRIQARVSGAVSSNCYITADSAFTGTGDTWVEAVKLS